MSPFNRESSFSLRAVSLLEPAAGIPVMTTLTDYTWHIQIFFGLAQYPNHDLNGLLNYWISSVQWLPPSWRNLLLIIRLLNLDELAQRMETYLSAGATEESHDYPVEEETEQEEGDRLSTTAIYIYYVHVCTIIAVIQMISVIGMHAFMIVLNLNRRDFNSIAKLKKILPKFPTIVYVLL